MKRISERGLPVLVCPQPEAQLAALGAQWLLPRSKRHPESGLWVAIWASAGLAAVRALAGDCEGNVEGDWFYGYCGGYQASFCMRTGDEGRKGDTQLVKCDSDTPIPDYDGPMPRSAIVGVAWLAGSAPVGDSTSFSTGLVEGETPPFADDPVLVVHSGQEAVLDWPGGPNQVVSDQLGYSNLAEAKWAWILRYARLLDEPAHVVRPRGGGSWIWEPPADLVLPTRAGMP
jgi:hypothetical protein